MSNFEKKFNYFLMAAIMELLVCLIVWLAISMLGALVLGFIFFLLDIAFLVHDASENYPEERKAEARVCDDDEKEDQ